MMKKLKKTLSGILAAAMMLTLLPSASITTEAALITYPTTALDTIEEGNYTVRMRLLTEESTESKPELSMGDNYIGYLQDAYKYAEVSVKDGKIKVTMDVDIAAGMMSFGYFKTPEQYSDYMAAKLAVFNGEAETIPEDVQAYYINSEDITETSEDLTIGWTHYTVEGYGQSAEGDYIDSITMCIPSCVPVYYMGLTAIGMGNGEALKYAQIAFYWDTLTPVDNSDDNTGDNNTDNSGNTGDDNTDNSGGTGDTEITNPLEGTTILTRYNELKEYFESLDEKDYITTSTDGDSEIGWVTLTEFFEKWDAAMADGTADAEEMKTELQEAYKKAYDPAYMRQKDTTLETGYTYQIPVTWYPATTKTIPFSGEDGDLSDFTVTVPDYENTTNTEFTNAVNSLITSATVEVKDRRNNLSIKWDGDTQVSGEPWLAGTILTSIGEISFSGEDTTNTVKIASPTTNRKKSLNYLVNSLYGGMVYLYNTVPFVVGTVTWNDGETSINKYTNYDGFLVLDYANAERISENDSNETDKSILRSLYDTMSAFGEGFIEYENYDGDTTSSSYRFDPAFINELIAEDGILYQIKSVLDDENATQQQIDDTYMQYYRVWSTAKSMKAVYTEYYMAIQNTYKAYLKQTDVYTEESLALLQEAIDYFDALENFSPRVGIQVNGETVYGYLPGENIELTEAEHNQAEETVGDNALYLTYKFSPDSLSDEQKEIGRKYWLHQYITRDYDPDDPSQYPEEGVYKYAQNYYRYRAMQKLDAALAALETYGDTTELKALVAEAEAITNSADVSAKYTADSVAALADAVSKVNTALENGKLKDSDIAALMEELQSAKDALIDISSLTDCIASAKAITENEEESGKYTIKSIKDLKSAIADAEEALNETGLTQADIAELKTTLQSSIDALVDRTALKAAIDHGNELVKQTDKYTDAAIRIYRETLAEAKELYGSVKTVTPTQIEAQIASLKKAEELLVPISDENLDKDNLADGKYTVTVNLWHATQDKESMGNQALYHTGIITVKDGKYYLTIMGHEVTVGVVTGKLKALQVKPGGTTDEDWVTPESVDSEKEGDYTFEFELTSKGEKEYLPSRIQVEEGTPMGTDWVESRLRISWDTLKKTEEDIKPGDIVDLEPEPDVTGPLYYADGETGVIVQAEEGVFPDGVTIVVKKIGLDIDGVSLALSKYVKQYELYEVTAYNSKGEEVQPDGIVSLTFPIPDSYDTSKLCVYHISDSGSLSLLQGTEDNGSYTIKTSKFSYFALAEKLGTTANKPGNSLLTTTKPTTTTTTTKPAATTTTTKTTTTTTPKTTTTTKTTAAKTGDTTETAWMFAVAAAALLVILGTAVKLRRRKR